ncbi:MAG: BamA/TamA family outer membrane protein [Ignavibacteriaceae bacterium]
MAQNQPQYELQTIEFRGNEEISSSVLSEIIYSQETPWWFWKFINSFTPFGDEPIYFDSSNIERDITALVSYYKANGFFQASFSSEYLVDTSSREIELIYNISEGEPSSYGKISFFGMDSVPYGIFEDIETDLTLDSSKRYVEEEVQQNISNFTSILQNSGYAFARFDSTVIFIDTTANTADLNIHYTTDILYLIDTVFVQKEGKGASAVSEEVIRKISGLEKDEPYSKEETRTGQARLFRTGLFNSININLSDSAKRANRIPMIIHGTIGELNELSPEIILNDQRNALNVGAGINYLRKNFLGGARKMTVSASFGLQDIFKVDYSNLIKKFSFRDTTLLGYFDSRVTFEQPYLFNEPIYGILDNYLVIEKQEHINLTRFGSRLTFDFELPHYTLINFFSTYYNIEQTNEVFRSNQDSLSRKLLSIIGFDLGKTTADNILFPTQGYALSLQMEHANMLPFLFSKLTDDAYQGALFYRVLFNSAYYLALGHQRDLIFAAKFKSGHMQPYYGDYGGLPVNRTFYAGGSSSIRGWGSNDLIPQGTPRVENFAGVNYKGGTFLIEGSTEIRYRFLDNIGTALFFDYGNVWLSHADFRYDELALAVGFGFRYYTQVAPFRLDFGFKFYDPKDKLFIWDNWKNGFFKNLEFHFGIGEAF